MHLYEIKEEYRTALGSFDPETGEIQEAALVTLNEISASFKDKAINVTAYFDELDAEAKAIGDAIDRLKSRQKATQNRSERLKTYLLKNMIESGITEVGSPEFKIKIGKCPPSVIIDDESIIPLDYMYERTNLHPDKNMIKTYLKLDPETKIPGVHLEAKPRLLIS